MTGKLLTPKKLPQQQQQQQDSFELFFWNLYRVHYFFQEVHFVRTKMDRVVYTSATCYCPFVSHNDVENDWI
jgi:hypothetical protein